MAEVLHMVTHVSRKLISWRWIRYSLLYMALLNLAQPSVRAGYLIDPAGGNVLFNDSTDYDDNVVSRPIGFTASFYGQSFSSIYVSTNGNLNFSGTNSWTNAGLPNTTAMIAPLWDDLFIYAGSGESIIESAVPGQYYAVTWDVSQFNNSPPRYQFQTVIFGADTTIGSTQFLQNDIVFAYQRVDANFSSNSATVGLNRGDGSLFATLPGLNNGDLTNANVGLLPTGPGQVALLRYSGGNYQASIVNVPEPSSFALIGLGLVAVAVYRKKMGNSTP